MNKRDEIVVTDFGNRRIQVFSSDGTYLRSFGTKGDTQGEFNYPAGIALDNNGHIVVVDSNNHRVQIFNEQGEFLSQFGGKGNLDRQLKDRICLSIDSDGNYTLAYLNKNLSRSFLPVVSFYVKSAVRVLSLVLITVSNITTIL